MSYVVATGAGIKAFARILFVLSILVLSMPVHADDLEDGRAAIGAGDYATALRLLKPLADQGNAAAQNAVGALYLEGWGVEQDYDEARQWFLKAAEQGHAKAQVNMGNLYDQGFGVPRDYAEAAKWFRMAAEQGYVQGQALLGAMYAVGEGVPQDFPQAVKWYRMAAEQGDAEAQYRLGFMYEAGEGVAPDSAETEKWYRMAAEQEHPLAKARLKALSTQASEPGDAENPLLARAMVVSASDLAQAYLWTRIMVEDVLPAAQKGVTLQLADETVTKSNVEQYQKTFQQRLSTYQEAIKRRGYKTVSGVYRAEATGSCARANSMFAGLMLDRNVAGVEITQRDSDAEVIISVEQDGKKHSLKNHAAIVESALVLQDAMNSEYFFRGDISSDEIIIRPDVAVLRAWPKWAGPPKKKDLEDCMISLRREEE